MLQPHGALPVPEPEMPEPEVGAGRQAGGPAGMQKISTSQVQGRRSGAGRAGPSRPSGCDLCWRSSFSSRCTRTTAGMDAVSPTRTPRTAPTRHASVQQSPTFFRTHVTHSAPVSSYFDLQRRSAFFARRRHMAPRKMDIHRPASLANLARVAVVRGSGRGVGVALVAELTTPKDHPLALMRPAIRTHPRLHIE